MGSRFGCCYRSMKGYVNYCRKPNDNISLNAQPTTTREAKQEH